MPKEKRVNKSKIEIEQRMKNLAKMRSNLAFIKEEFFPALTLASESVQDAEMWLSSFSTGIMQSFLGLMKEKKFKELGLDKLVDPNSPKHAEWVKVVELFNDMSVFEVRTHAENMKNEISKFYRDDMGSRKLDTLKVNWFEVPEK